MAVYRKGEGLRGEAGTAGREDYAGLIAHVWGERRLKVRWGVSSARAASSLINSSEGPFPKKLSFHMQEYSNAYRRVTHLNTFRDTALMCPSTHKHHERSSMKGNGHILSHHRH